MARSNKTTFVKQAAILAAAGLLVRFIGFLYRLPLTRLIGDQGNGIYSAGYYLYMLFLIVSSAGLPAAISKMVSERIELKEYRNAHNVFKVSFWVAGSAGLFCSLILWLGAEWLSVFVDSPKSYWSIITLSPTVFVVAIIAVFRGYFQGMKNMIPTAISQIVEQIFNAVFSVYLASVFVSQGIEYGAAGGTAGTGIGAVAGLLIIAGIYLLVRPMVTDRAYSDTNRRRFESKKNIAIILIKTAVPIIIGTAIFSITNLIDMKMVMSRLLASGVYDYDQAETLYGQLTAKYVSLTTLPVSISTALATATIPNIAASVIARNNRAVSNKINASFRLTMILSIPSAVGIGVLGSQILWLLFPSYREGGMLLTVGSVSIVFLALNQILTGMLQGTGKTYIPAVAAFFGGLVKIPLNYYLIANPQINVLGAVISTIACYMVASAINLYFLMKLSRVKLDFTGAIIKPLTASALMGLSCYVVYYFLFYILQNNTISVLLAVILGIFTYVAVLLLIKGIKKEDLITAPMGNKLVAFLDRLGVL